MTDLLTEMAVNLANRLINTVDESNLHASNHTNLINRWIKNTSQAKPAADLVSAINVFLLP